MVMMYKKLFRAGWKLDRAGLSKSEAKVEAKIKKDSGYKKARALKTKGGSYLVAYR